LNYISCFNILSNELANIYLVKEVTLIIFFLDIISFIISGLNIKNKTELNRKIVLFLIIKSKILILIKIKRELTFVFY
jgi:hypothetical protein